MVNMCILNGARPPWGERRRDFMNIIYASIAIFAFGYFLNMFYITVLYHRGLAHGAVELNPLTRKWVVATGSWVTGIDPKAWACMHRLHHKYSDTEKDPHSPVNSGIVGVMFAQLESYKKALVGLALGRKEYVEMVRDLDFPIHVLNRKGLWLTPYILHALIGISLGFAFGSWIPGLAYWLGIMSHPVQGWLVNSFSHQYGYRNFDLDDHSKNNPVVALLTMGEGYQNNHHAEPRSAKFSKRWFEWDAGYLLCLAGEKLNILKIAESDQGPQT